MVFDTLRQHWAAMSAEEKSFRKHQVRVWLITFLAYATFHITRKPFSVVKSSLNPDENDDTRGWSPFNKSNGGNLLGVLDTVFLAVYAVSLFFVGHIGDRSNLRIFLPVGMLGCAVSIMLWALAYWCDIHSLAYFLFANVVVGVFQATGWPAVVCVMSRWFSRGKRGLVMGVWNSHTSVGNILGTVMSSAALKFGMNGFAWPWAFVLPACTSVAVALLTAVFLIPHPTDLGFDADKFNQSLTVLEDETKAETNEPSPVLSEPGTPPSTSVSNGPKFVSPTYSVITDELNARANADYGTLDEYEVAPVSENSLVLNVSGNDVIEIAAATAATTAVASPARAEPVNFRRALFLPGVLEYSFALFFAKLVAYTFLFWLPYYLKGLHYGATEAGYLSTWFDIGGIVGGILAGHLADRSRKPGIICVVSMLLATPMLVLYRHFTKEGLSSTSNAVFMVFLGFIVNAPYALITTAVSADLGSQPALGNDATALATVTGIIDGVGSAGAAFQGILVPVIAGVNKKGEGNWDAVYAMLAGCSAAAALLLTRVFIQEVKQLMRKNEHVNEPTDTDALIRVQPHQETNHH